jgi:peptidoglycan/xylan/chitin deacetylase (PgdA/CDA1 family)
MTPQVARNTDRPGGWGKGGVVVTSGEAWALAWPTTGPGGAPTVEIRARETPPWVARHGNSPAVARIATMAPWRIAVAARRARWRMGTRRGAAPLAAASVAASAIAGVSALALLPVVAGPGRREAASRIALVAAVLAGAGIFPAARRAVAGELAGLQASDPATTSVCGAGVVAAVAMVPLSFLPAASGGGRLVRFAGCAAATCLALALPARHDPARFALVRLGTRRSSAQAARQTDALVAAARARAASGKVAHLTFDDGPDATWTPAVLDVLAHAKAHATFFAVGDKAARLPGLLRRAADEGHGIGGHGWSHTALTDMTRAEVATELERSTEAISDATGRAVTLLRPPFGDTDDRVAGVAEERDQRIVMWDVSPRDWERPGSATIAERVLAGVQPGSIVLLHDSGGDRSQTVGALPIIIERLRARGYRLAPIEA